MINLKFKWCQPLRQGDRNREEHKIAFKATDNILFIKLYMGS